MMVTVNIESGGKKEFHPERLCIQLEMKAAINNENIIDVVTEFCHFEGVCMEDFRDLLMTEQMKEKLHVAFRSEGMLKFIEGDANNYPTLKSIVQG